MQMIYGSYAHEANEVTLRTSAEIVRSDRGYAQKMLRRWAIAGRKIGTSLTDQLRRLDEAYQVDFQDAYLLDNDGQVVISLPNGDSLSGVRVVRPLNLPDLSNAQLATYVDYECELEADFLLPDAGGLGEASLLEFRESLQITGGKSIKRLVQRPSGDPVLITVVERPGYFATQSGSMVSTDPNATIPAPIWPDALAGPPSIERQSPEVKGGQLISYAIAWQYDYLSVTELTGRPTQRL